jgi:hypothetical protein
MSNTPALIDYTRTILLVLLVFFAAVFLGSFDIFFAPALFYAYWYYYKKSKRLQKQLDECNAVGPEKPTTNSAQDVIPPPPSTDA